ncbi:hypothetical protein QBC38DRAFT_505571 [Podospora fimiseda]|uniref:FAD-binding domain-containing protein n=1 Tax=Podospora fimiseda TaxID=252190 RepID=A0AAN6YLL3_9PEZI|nr:hypothetical protein QBC38DRAFT_505571 [Podospora fimiseda]
MAIPPRNIWNEPSIEFQTGEAAITRMKQVLGKLNLAEPFRSAVDETLEDSNFLSQMHYWPTKACDERGKRRVTLAGDAAHALLPGELTLDEAVGQYEKEVFERGPVAVQGSLDDAKDLMRVEGLEDGRTARKGFAQIGREE